MIAERIRAAIKDAKAKDKLCVVTGITTVPENRLAKAQKQRCENCIHKLYNKDPGWCYMFENMQPHCRKLEYDGQEDKG